MQETANDLITKTALQDSVLALVLLALVAGIGIVIRALWKAFVIPIRDGALNYLEKQAKAMEQHSETLKDLHEEIKALRKDIGG